MRSELDLIRQRLENLEQDNTGLHAQLETSEVATRRERRRMRWQSGLALAAVIGAIFVSPANRQALAQVYGVTLATLNTRVTNLEGRATSLEGRAAAVETKNAQQDFTLASLQTQINNTRYKSFVVQPDGTVVGGVSGFTVTHVSSGVYDINFLAGSLPGPSTPIVHVLGNGGRINMESVGNSDGSLFFEVSNPGGDQYFNVVVLPYR